MAMMPFLDQMPLGEQSKNMVLAMMNAEHPDAIRAYIRHFGGKKKAMSAKLCDVGCERITLSYIGPGMEKGECTMPYVDAEGNPLVIRSVGDCRRALVGMAYTASEALGEKIELPARPAPASASASSGGDRDFGPHREEMQELIRQLGSDHRPPPEEMAQLAQRLQELRALAEGGGNPAGATETGSGTGGGSSSTYTAFKGGYVAAPRSDIFKGEGSKLGSATPAPAAAVPANAGAPPPPLREVDAEQPVVRLRVQLLDRRPAQVVVNRDFTILQLRGWLDHHQGEAATKAYHLMEVTGFPPKKLTDMSATVEQLGLSSTSSLSCRPA